MISETDHSDLLDKPIGIVRQAIRNNHYQGHTAGLCKSVLQCNIVILPQTEASDFQTFCQQNKQACPLVGVSEPGNPGLTALGDDIDIRSDLPLYTIFRHGEPVAQFADIRDMWRDDFVTFALGCSFTFETALMLAGVPLRHIERNTTVPMYRTNIQTRPVGRFGGSFVVSMRPVRIEDLASVFRICEQYPHAHGMPLHTGDPGKIGIPDISLPDWGDATRIFEGEVPVFWACGVTSQVAIEKARPDLCITHAPGAMLITDIDDLMNKHEERAVPPVFEKHVHGGEM
ncbi:MAG: putative hydro-lyase [Cohaesibacteraceae bacterium]|nr:putative hydro-lyase [Cohaesibacteraceae bacterium]MBL4876859.1 putative hydro-lyase [Cohaesibacteraceae bacterium]